MADRSRFVDDEAGEEDGDVREEEEGFVADGEDEAAEAAEAAEEEGGVSRGRGVGRR